MEFNIEKRVKELNEAKADCERVKATLESAGWREFIEPMIEKMILDITGGKANGRWYGGLLDRARKEEKREFYIGYKQALIDLHRHVYAYPDSIKRYEDERGKLISGASKTYTTPMIDDSRYAQ